METQFNPKLLAGPIPGMSLTSEPGAYPWENPSQLNTLDEAVEYYSEKILQPEVEDKVLIALDDGVSAEKLAEMLAISGTMNGIHSLDIAYIVMPYIKELAMYLADLYQTDYIESYSTHNKERIPYGVARNVIVEALRKNKEEGVVMPEEEMAMPSKGLMSRPPMEAPMELEELGGEVPPPEEEIV